MFKPALIVFRLLPLAAGVVASVAIGASAQAPDAPGVEAHLARQAAVDHASRTPRPATGVFEPIDAPLLARTDVSSLLATAYPVESLDTALIAPSPKADASGNRRSGFEWPRPNRWTSLFATLALGAFFFLRRIV